MSGHEFKLWSEREEPADDRQIGLQKLQEKNRNCEHVVLVGFTGPASLAVKMRGQDLCPHCTRREAAYWHDRAKTAEGQLALGSPAPRPPRES